MHRNEDYRKRLKETCWPAYFEESEAFEDLIIKVHEPTSIVLTDDEREYLTKHLHEVRVAAVRRKHYYEYNDWMRAHTEQVPDLYDLNVGPHSQFKQCDDATCGCQTDVTAYVEKWRSKGGQQWTGRVLG